MNINVIYSFADADNGDYIPQRFADFEAQKTAFNSAEGFFTMLTAKLSKRNKQKLQKISCSVQNGREELGEDHWYFQRNGKYYDDEIPTLMKDLFGVDITYEPINK